MYEAEIIKKFEGMPVFSLGDINQIINNRIYAKKFLKRMLKGGKIFKIIKNTYTLHKDPFLVSTFLIKPSYISGASALSYHKYITQIPSEVFCATLKNNRKITFEESIHFVHTNYFFGFEIVNYEHVHIPVATPEKAIIDSFSVIPVSIFEEAFEDIDRRVMVGYLKRIKKSSIIKRVGYLMEKGGYDAYHELKKYINYKYIPLDPLIKNKGVKDKKWGVVINTL
jgi:predicted transcriptional regulator of viral defense system